MPESKFTEQEMVVARSTDLAELFESEGYTVMRRGNWQTLKEAQHIVIKGNNRYYDNYKKEWGDAITFLENYKNLPFAEAVETLLKQNGYEWNEPPKEKVITASPKEKEPAEFVLPKANENNKRVFSYLRKRGISYQVIQNLVDAGLLYEDKQYHNCVFVGKDAVDTPVFAYKRGTVDKDGVGFKGDVECSDKTVAFRLPSDPEKDIVNVYESPIDLASHMTLRRDITSNAVALCCLHDGALETYLKENPQIKKIVLCLDADKWGREAAARMKEKYEAQGFTVYDPIPPKGKDWNEYLLHRKNKEHQKEK